MVAQIACNPVLSPSFAAFAAAPLALYEGTPGTMGVECKARKGKAVPILEIHGGKDERIAYAGGMDAKRPGLSTVGVPEWLGGWAGRDKCEAGNRTVGLKNEKGVEVKGGNVTEWKCPSSGTKKKGKEGEEEGLVTGIFSKKMKHVWPTVENSGIDGSRVILKFFERWGGKVENVLEGVEKRKF